MSDRFIREAECQAITGLSRATRRREEQAGRFPKRVKITSNISGWLLSEVVDWVEQRKRLSDDSQSDSSLGRLS